MDMTYANEIKKNDTSYNTKRLLSQFEYAFNFATTKDDSEMLQFLTSELDYFLQVYKQEGCITNTMLDIVEKRLSKISKQMKETIIHCVGHAHIDMNWMWGYDETVDITLNTFRTVLRLMDMYPQFTFSQSQASIYEIVEKYDPSMLEIIKQRIQEKRWEVTAAFWTESDKNMPSSESLLHHMKYTKKYLKELLDIDPSDLKIGFEPDTFGHPAYLPEILNQGGLQYYYFCRGLESRGVFRWRSPSGAEVLAYQEPIWYNAAINPYDFSFYPEFLLNNKLKSGLKVYGVGDHGGGPTQSDIEMLVDMNQWPLMPTLQFSTYSAFFNDIDHADFPIFEGEINPIFEGCYTSQSQIKSANKNTERMLYVSELLSLTSPKDDQDCKSYDLAWKNILFNQFHDILTGSGTIETKNYAMGKYQETLAIIKSQNISTLNTFASKVSIPEIYPNSGLNYLVFHPSSSKGTKLIEIPLWDLKFDIHKLQVLDPSGKSLSYVVIDPQPVFYWSHFYQRILVQIELDSFGYKLIHIGPYQIESIPFVNPNPVEQTMRYHPVQNYVIENESLLVEFDSNGSVKKILSKDGTSSQFDFGNISGHLRYVLEDAKKGMTAWNIGKYLAVKDLVDFVTIRDDLIVKNHLYQQFGYEVKINDSKAIVIYKLHSGLSRIDVDIQLDWKEIGSFESGIGSLEYCFTHNQNIQEYQYDSGNLLVTRAAQNNDVIGQNFTSFKMDKQTVIMMNMDNYGYRSTQDSVSMKLLRSSIDPDKYPEIGTHHFNLSIFILDDQCKNVKDHINSRLFDCVAIRKYSSTNELPSQGQLLKILEGSCQITKVERTGHIVLIRFTESKGLDQVIKILIPEAKSATEITLLDSEKSPISVHENILSIPIKAYQIKTIKVNL